MKGIIMHKLIVLLVITSLTSVSFSQEATTEVASPQVPVTAQEAVVQQPAPQAAVATQPVVAPQPLPMVEEPAPQPAQQHYAQFTPLNSNDTTAPGIAVITSYPAEAEISLNGIVVGTGAVTVPNLLPGRYVVTASYADKTEMEEIIITAGGLTKENVAVKKKTHMLISMGNMVTIFQDDQNSNQVALGPAFEIGVSIMGKVLISQDFHWGLWSKTNDTTSTTDDNVSTDGQYTAAGGNLKVYWQHMSPKEHIGIFLGAGMGFYAINDYSYYYSYDYSTSSSTTNSSFDGDYFGGPSVMAMFGGLWTHFV